MNDAIEKMEFAVEELFEDIPGDPDNVVMKIPPDLCEKMGWNEGDTLTITLEDGAICIAKHE